MECNTYPRVIARIQGENGHPQLHGMVRFFQCRDGVIIEAEIHGLPKTETGFLRFISTRAVAVSVVGFLPLAGILIQSGPYIPIMRGICHLC